MSKVIIMFMVLIIIATLAGCNDEVHTVSSDLSVTGTIDFSDSAELEKVVRAELQLVDDSIADGPHVIISEATVAPINEVPATFTIYYNESDISQSRLYSVNANVYLLDINNEEYKGYITTQVYPVLTNGFSSEVNLLVEPIN